MDRTSIFDDDSQFDDPSPALVPDTLAPDSLTPDTVEPDAFAAPDPGVTDDVMSTGIDGGGAGKVFGTAGTDTGTDTGVEIGAGAASRDTVVRMTGTVPATTTSPALDFMADVTYEATSADSLSMAGDGPPGAPTITGSISTLASYLTDGFWNFNSQTRQYYDINDTGPYAFNLGTLEYNVTGTTASGVDTFYGTYTDTNGVSAARAVLIREAFKYYEEILGINFVETTGTSTSVDFFFTDNGSGAYQAPEFWTGAGGAIDVSVINVNSGWQGGESTLTGYTYQTVLHEIGHALGLGHQGPYNGAASYGTDATYFNDSWALSMMSYFSQTENTGGQTVGYDYAFLSSAMTADLWALRTLYEFQDYGGTNFGPSTAFTENTVYGVGTNITAARSAVFNIMSSWADTNAFTIVDGGGIDTINFSNFSADQRFDLTVISSADTNGAPSNIGGLTGNMNLGVGTVIENAVGGSGNDVFVGNAYNNTFTGNAGNDTMYAYSGNDYVSGGNDNDYLYGGIGNDTLYGGNDNDYLYGGDDTDTLYGGAGNDRLYSGELNFDYIYGGDGFDIYYAGAGNFGYFFAGGNDDDSDYAYGGTANDRFYAGTSFASPTGNGYFYSSGGAGNDIHDGGTDADVAYGGADNDNLSGNAGNDVLYGDAGNDFLYGGTGNDNLYAGTGTDNLFGGAGNDNIYGGAGGGINAATIDGGAGDDYVRIDTFSGSSLDGGTGVDSLVLDVGVSSGGLMNLAAGTYSFNGTYFYDIKGFENYTNLNANGHESVIVGGGVNIIQMGGGNNSVNSGAGDDTLYGGDGNDTLNGSTGADRMYGGADDDIYYVDNAGDQAIDVAGAGGGLDRVFSSVTHSLSTYIEGLQLLGAANLNGTGNALDNRLVGNAGHNYMAGQAGDDIIIAAAGNDTLDGGSGGDLMFGRQGDDIYYVDDAGDRAIESPGQGYDLVFSSISMILGNQVEELRLLGVADLYGIGSNQDSRIQGNSGNNSLNGQAGDDIILGGAGNDSLVGGTGNDTMYGQAGDDIYYVDSTDDVIVEGAGQGYDRVLARATFTLSANVEDLQLLGGAPLSAFGNGGDNRITGNSASNTLAGGAGNDILIGAGGSDVLIGGADDDQMFGGAGADTFVLQNGWGADRVNDFSTVSGDVVDLSAVAAIVSFADLTADHLSNLGGNALITDGANTLLLIGVAAGSLLADDFLF